MRVIIICERSGNVRREFRKRGHEAYSCDIVPADDDGEHIQDDALNVIGRGWDLMIAHPPCTYLSYVGNRHWNNPGRSELREQAMAFFMSLVNAPIDKICVENPLGYPCRIYRKPDQIIHPYFLETDRKNERVSGLKTCHALSIAAMTNFLWHEPMLTSQSHCISSKLQASR